MTCTRILFFISLICWPQLAYAEVTLIQKRKPIAEIVIDTRGSKGSDVSILTDAGQWLIDSLHQSTGVKLTINDKASDTPAVILARADAWPDVAKDALKSDVYDGFCIVTTAKRVYLLGNSETAVRHAVATLLRKWGFRWFAPSPRWHIIPKMDDVTINLNLSDAPALVGRSIWYAYGMSGDDLKPLMQNYQRWTIANRLSRRGMLQTGHSYGNIIRRNSKVFEEHPEYYALLADGKRDKERAINARKLCYTNPGLIELVIQDRLRLLERNRKVNPASFMVSVDPSDGQGTCHCENCQRLKTTSDRVFHLANQVAKGLQKKYPKAWVGLYAYSSHRLPPTFKVEPNVYVQVAMGFNRTQYSLPELVERWSQKVGAIGLREYYGVEAWDWGLPGRMRGGNVNYHRKWIPYYAQRKLNAINAETNANWGAQTLGLYVASQLMWNSKVDVNDLVEEYFKLAFDDVAEPMRKIYAKFDEAPPLRSATLVPLFRGLESAYKTTKSESVRQRIVDLMAYLVYVAQYREFDLVRNRRATRDDRYYEALLPLMNYAWRIRHRDMVHYYALARRLCNGLPIADKRLDFYLANKEKAPIWRSGDSYSDQEIVELFHKSMKTLEADKDPTVAFSRYLEPARIKSNEVGPSKIIRQNTEGAARFRNGLRGYLIPAEQSKVQLSIRPTSRRVTFTVYLRGDTVLLQKEYRSTETKDFEKIFIDLPRANEYRVEMTGSFELQIPKETPFVFEASITHPSWIEYSGPHFFYVPRGTKELIVDANPRLSLFVPGQKKRLDVSPAQREKGKDYVVIPVPPEAAGRMWHTSSQTRGRVSLLNVPPLMSFHPGSLFVPREVAESDGLTTRK